MSPIGQTKVIQLNFLSTLATSRKYVRIRTYPYEADRDYHKVLPNFFIPSSDCIKVVALRWSGTWVAYTLTKNYSV